MILLDPHAQVEVESGRSGVRASSSPTQPGNHLLGRRLGGVGTPPEWEWDVYAIAVRVGGLAVNTCGQPVVGPGHLDI